MINNLTCITCGKDFPFYQNKNRPIPRFCSHQCRGHTGFRPGGAIRISELTEEEKLERLKKSFEKHVIRQEGCWGWKGSIARGGYPVMSCRSSIGPDRGHRASWFIHKGLIPEGLCVCHKCDNPICTNPDHLWIGTHKENNDDKMAKSRQSKLSPPHKSGSQNGASKLKEDQVIEIKKMLVEGKSAYSIAPLFDVSKQTILRIKNGVNWSHINI
jgi:hypothetical protein